MSGCPSPNTNTAKYRTLYMSFRATETIPQLWQYNAKWTLNKEKNINIVVFHALPLAVFAPNQSYEHHWTALRLLELAYFYQHFNELIVIGYFSFRQLLEFSLRGAKTPNDGILYIWVHRKWKAVVNIGIQKVGQLKPGSMSYWAQY